jgi:hypothetical protein
MPERTAGDPVDELEGTFMRHVDVQEGSGKRFAGAFVLAA